jgi:hypothetical protein
LVQDHASASPEEAKLLASVISTSCHIDKIVAPEEFAIARALFAAVPQLRENPQLGTPPTTDRTRLLAELDKVSDMRMRRQCFIIAVEIALCAGGVHDDEDTFVDELRKVLRIDDAFARQAILVLGTKYACIK